MPVIERSDAPSLSYAVAFADTARGSVLLTHGFAEYKERYAPSIEYFRSRGLNVGSYDLRGHGDSGGKRAYIDEFDDYSRDAEAVLAKLAEDERWTAPGQPILFAHSTGGLVALRLALRQPSAYRGLVLSSPFLGFAIQVAPWKKFLGRTLSRRVPTFSQPAQIAGSFVTRDPELAKQSDTDPRKLRRATARWFTEVERVQAELFAQAGQVRLPVHCLAAGHDRVASVEATRRFFDQLGSQDKSLTVIEEGYHELLNDLGREQHRETFAELMLKLAATAPQG